MFDGAKFGEDMVGIVRGYVDKTIAPLIEANATLVAENKAFAERIAELEQREAGIAVDVVRSMIAEAVETLPAPEPGKDGADCDMDAVKELVAEAVSALPPAEKGSDGTDCDMEAVSRMIAERVAEMVKDIPPGKDGLGLANALKDANGHLILTMTDGTTRDIGMVDGKDGKTFTLDDFDIVPLNDPRDYKLCFTNGDMMHSFELELPGFVDKAVWKETEAYRKGDGVTWAGSFWIAERDVPGKPDTADSGWRLAVKRGRDGKDAK